MKKKLKAMRTFLPDGFYGDKYIFVDGKIKKVVNGKLKELTQSDINKIKAMKYTDDAEQRG